MQPDADLSGYTICIHSVQMIFYASQYLKSPIQNYLIKIL